LVRRIGSWLLFAVAAYGAIVGTVALVGRRLPDAAPRGPAAFELPDVAAMQALDVAGLGRRAVADVAGYRAPDDGGGGIFDWRPGSTEPTDGVLVLGSARKPSGRWVRRWTGARLSPAAAGAVGDGRHDDGPAFARLVALSRHRGAFTIALAAGHRYYVDRTLDLSTGAPGLAIVGPASPLSHSETWVADAFGARIELPAASGAHIKLGQGQTLRDVLVWRHGLSERARSLADVRSQVAAWFAENGVSAPRSVGVTIRYDESTVAHCAIIGFNTGILASGGRFVIRHTEIEAAGHAIEVAGSTDTSLIDDVQTTALWSNAATGSDAYGDHSYRPGSAFYIHGGADGLQIDRVMAIGWVDGIWLAGEPKGEDWLISILQPDIETPPDDGAPTAAIRTTGDVRRLTIVDPRIVAGGPGAGRAAALDFAQDDPDPVAAANNNVTVIGGTLEVADPTGNAVVLGPGSTGSIIGTTMNLTPGNATGPLVSVAPGSGIWSIVAPRLSGNIGRIWLSVPPEAARRIHVSGLFPPPSQGR
jgi:hypothetical protein